MDCVTTLYMWSAHTVFKVCANFLVYFLNLSNFKNFGICVCSNLKLQRTAAYKYIHVDCKCFHMYIYSVVVSSRIFTRWPYKIRFYLFSVVIDACGVDEEFYCNSLSNLRGRFDRCILSFLNLYIYYCEINRTKI